MAKGSSKNIVFPEGFNVNKKRTGLGIALNEDRVIALKAEISSKGIVVLDADEQVLDSGTLGNGKINDLDSLLDSLKKLKKRMGFKAKYVTTNLPHQFYFMKRFVGPEGYFSASLANIEWEIKHHINGNISDYAVSTVNTGKTDNNKTNTIILASHHRVIDERSEVMTRLGLSLSAIDPDMLAIQNAIAVALSNSLEKMVMVVDASSPYTAFSLLSNGVFYPGGFFPTSKKILFGKDEQAVKEFAAQIVKVYNMAYRIMGLSMKKKKPDMLIILGRLADEAFNNDLASALDISLFDGNPFHTSTVKSKMKKSDIPWTSLIKPFGLALRTDHD